MNRGIARRTVFEEPRDVRFFLSRLARAVRAGWIEVHSYCVLTTHFHLLVRCPDGNLSQAMCRVLDEYVRWFNRSRRRDGPLFRGRFRSRPVESIEYRRRLVNYIDANPVQAGLAKTPFSYPHGSALWYARRRRPPWLERKWVEEETRALSGSPEYDPHYYVELFTKLPSQGLTRLIEQRIESGARGPDPLDDLLGLAPERVRDWMCRKAALADGTGIGLPVCDPAIVRGLIAEERMKRPDWRPARMPHYGDTWQLLEIALLRELCGSTWATIGCQLGIQGQRAMRAYGQHAPTLKSEPEYGENTARLASTAIARCLG